MSEYFTDLMGMLWVQPDGPATISYPLFCHDLDGTDVPVGDVTTALCRTPLRGWATVVESQGAPSRATGTIETWLAKTRTWLQKKVGERCPTNIYVHHTDCPPDDIFPNYITGQVLQYAFFTSRGRGNQVKTMGDEGQAASPTGATFDWSARPMPPEYWKLDHTRRSIAEVEPLRAIAFCNTLNCGGTCGPYQGDCDEGIIVADADGVAVADVWFTANGGATWAAQAGPWAAVTTDINSCVCVFTGPGATRHIVQLGTTAGGTGANGEVAYTDNAGANWTVVDLGAAIVNGFGTHGGSLFALDHNNNYIWSGWDDGSIYFSSDGGASWTDQVTGVDDPINSIDFVDFNYGWAGGDDQELLRTSNGGTAWAAPTVLPGVVTDNFFAVETITDQVAWVGGNDDAAVGVLFRTADAGATWTNYLARLQAAENYPGGVINGIGDIDFIDEFCGAITGGFTNTSSELFKGTWRTFDGGWNWEFYYDADDLLDGAAEYLMGNSVWVCDYNHIFSVGEVSDSTGLIEELTARGSV